MTATERRTYIGSILLWMIAETRAERPDFASELKFAYWLWTGQTHSPQPQLFADRRKAY